MIETCRGYIECAKIAQLVARYIRALGYHARAHIDANYRLMCVPVAVDAGLGELSRMGYLVTDRYGPRVRLSIVTTSLPMAADRPVNLGVRDFCTKCRKCASNCPAGAIPKGNELSDTRGTAKWVINPEACYGYWRRSGTDCGICMRVCPFSRPPTPIHNLVRFLLRRNVLARRLAAAGDELIYGKRPRPARPVKWTAAGLRPQTQDMQAAGFSPRVSGRQCPP
jgi:reductive dehalogenase